MVWYKPRTWFRKPKPTATIGGKTASQIISEAKASGVKVTGTATIGGRTARQIISGGGGGVSAPTTTVYQAEAEAEARAETGKVEGMEVRELPAETITTREDVREARERRDVGEAPQTIKEKYEEAEEKVSGFLNIPSMGDWREQFLSKLDVDEREFFLGRVKDIKAGEKDTGIITQQPEFWRGYGTALYEDIRTRPLKYGALVGGGAILRGIYAGAGGVIKTGMTIGGAGLTTAYGVGKYGEFQTAPTTFAKGEVIGIATGEIGAMGIGFGAGARAGGKIVGWWGTRGRDYIPLSKLTTKDIISGKDIFPTAPRYKHLKLFEQRGGAFHTTGQKFWGKDIIPSVGKSELAGLYGSPYVSPYFGRIGKGTSYKLLPSIKDLMVSGKPAIAFLKPTKFRVVDVIRVGRGKAGSYEFVKQPKPGRADIPRMKTEIEAVFRPEAGAYEFISGKTYTKIGGKRVPIDIFKYKKGDLDLGIKPPKKKLDLIGGKGEYSLSGLRDSSIIKPSAYGVGVSYKPSKKDYRPDYKIPSYKPSYKPSKPPYKPPYTPPPYKPDKYKPSSYKIYKPSYYRPPPPFYDYPMEYPTKKKKPMRPGRLPGVPSRAELLRAQRIFIRTPSLLAVKRFEEFGIAKPELPRVAEVTGLFPREFGIERLPKIELPVTLIGKVTRKTIRKGNIKKVKKKK